MGSLSLTDRIANQLKTDILSGTITTGQHISVTSISNTFGVSRTPARHAMVLLHEQGYLEQKLNKGFFVTPIANDLASEKNKTPALDLEEPSEYYQLADDWVNYRIPQDITESFVRNKYQLTKTKAIELLNCAARDGWLEPKPGYGWRLLEVAKSKADLEHIYKARAMIEPAAILEPTFKFDADKLRELKDEQKSLLATGLENVPVEKIIKSGWRFHEELNRQSQSIIFNRLLKQLNNMRKLIEYQSMIDLKRLEKQILEHIKIIELIEDGEMIDAAFYLKQHLAGSLSQKVEFIENRNQQKTNNEDRPTS